AVRVHLVEAEAVAFAARGEQDLLAVRRPRGVPAVVVAEPLDVLPVRVHDENATTLADRAAEGDLLAVGRPGRAAAAVLALGELLYVRAVGVHDVDVHRAVAIGGEGDLLAVG